ncbi:MAG TPA: YfiR family protein [Thermoanaerobaculia bacterium]|nr:YfiR family protein [Thermoanaerobaculia bacterium]
MVLLRAPRALLLLAVLLLVGTERAWADAQGESGKTELEYQVKAAFLFNFTKFVEWPSDVFTSPGDPVTVCVMGDDSFGESLDAVVQGETVNGRRLKVHRTRSPAELRACHMLFVPRSERRQSELLSSLRGAGILTVGDGDGFLSDGGIIRFVLDQNRVRFEINHAAAEANRLKLSSKLLRLARRVYTEQPGD